jgi:hypothetical protein
MASQALKPSSAPIQARERSRGETASNRPRWSEAEDRLLERCLAAALPRQVIARIVERSVAEVEARVRATTDGREAGTWTRSEVLRFKRVHGSHTDEDLARQFGRSVREVRALARAHGLSKDKAFVRQLWGRRATLMPRWAAAELEILIARYPTCPNRELARELGRSVASIVSKASTLQLKKSIQRLQAMGRENVSVRYSAR